MISGEYSFSVHVLTPPPPPPSTDHKGFAISAMDSELLTLRWLFVLQ